MTEQEKREIVQAVLDAISSKAQDLENVTTLTTLDGVTSLPVLTNGRVVAVVALSALTRNVDAAVASLDTAIDGTRGQRHSRCLLRKRDEIRTR